VDKSAGLYKVACYWVVHTDPSASLGMTKEKVILKIKKQAREVVPIPLPTIMVGWLCKKGILQIIQLRSHCNNSAL
jgi:hypothetical protein